MGETAGNFIGLFQLILNPIRDWNFRLILKELSPKNVPINLKPY